MGDEGAAAPEGGADAIAWRRYARARGSFSPVWERFSAVLRRELEKDAARGAAFLCLPVLLVAGAAVYFALPTEPDGHVLISLLGLLALAAHLARSRQGYLLLLTACFVFMLGVSAAKLETRRAATPMVGSDVTTNITGRLVRLEHQASGRVRLIIDLLSTKRPELHYPPDRVRLTAREAPPDLRPGDAVSGLVRLMSPAGPVRPGSYDFSFTSYFAGRGAVGFFMSGPNRVEADEPLPLSARPARWLENTRLALANRIRAHLAGVEGEVAVALIAGLRAGIPEEINEALRRTGLAHVLSISGLHMALVAVTVMTILRAFFALFPAFSSRVPVKKYAAAAALVFCTFYLALSGAAVAAQRSYIMLAVMLAALLFDRAALTMRNVSIAALVIVILSPHEVVGPSFQMSFAATAALVAGYAAWTEWRRGRDRAGPPSGSAIWRLARMVLVFFAGLAATSIIAGTATTLFGVWHFQRASPLSLPANLAAMPLVSAIVMPFAVLSILTMPFGLDGIFLKIMGYGISGMINIANWFSERSPIDGVGLIPFSAFLSLTTALVILVVSTTRMRLAALPFIAAGIALIAVREFPDVLIAEDGRLVGVRGYGSIAVNRSRPNAFTMGDWTHALKAATVIKPTTEADRPLQNAVDETATAFFCREGLCLARHESGALIAHAEHAEAARIVCGTAALIVVDDATVDEDLCPARLLHSQGMQNQSSEVGKRLSEEKAHLLASERAPGTIVITKRQLARKGAATVRFEETDAGIPKANIVFAIGEPWRPWHEHRAWSRAARGLAPYRRD